MTLFFVDIAEHESVAARKRMLRGQKTKKEDFLLEKFVQKKGFLKTCAYIILYIRENG